MARLTRKLLTALGIEDENVQDQIIEAHTETTDALKEQRDKYKLEAEKLPDIQKELEDFKSKGGEEDKYKAKYEDLKKQFDDFKTEQEQKETTAKKKSAYKQLLKKAGVSENRIDSVLKVSDFNGIEFDDDGKVKDAEKMLDSIKKEWKDFIVKAETKGAEVNTPPASDNKNVHVGRAAQLQKQYYEQRYGTKQEED